MRDTINAVDAGKKKFKIIYMSKKQTKKIKKKRKGLFFRFIRKIACFFYGKRTMIGIGNISNEPCVIVGNHAQLNGPLTAELKFPYKKKTWCIGSLMNLKEAPQYALEDFWGYKPKKVQWFYKGLAYIVSPLLVYVHTNADTIGVYKDNRVLSTFKNSVRALQEGLHIILFPEYHASYNNIVNEFQTRFVDVARLYYKETGKELSFVPMYIAAKLKTVVYGKPIKCDSTMAIEEQRNKICEYLKSNITKMAQELPEHTVIPYANIRKKNYPKNK